MSDPNIVFQQAAACCERGAFAEAVALYQQLAAQIPGHPQILSALGNAQMANGEVDEGVAALRLSLEIVPHQPGTWCNLARGLRLRRQLDEALTAVDKALSLEPVLFEAWVCRGNILWDREDWSDALAAYEQAYALRPNDPRILFNCGNALQRLKRPADAVAAFARAVTLAPDYADAYNNMARALEDLQRSQEALAALDKALALRPDYADAHFNRGISLGALERLDEALAAFSCALELNPAHAEAWRWRAVVFQNMDRHAEAVADLDHALQLKADYADAEFDRSVSLTELQRFDEALAGYDRVIAARPDYDHAVFNRAAQALMLGDFAAGWQGYERRWRHKEAAVIVDGSQPCWTGREDIAGKTLFVSTEQGFGDCVQFCRYVPLLAERGARVILEAPARLVPLLKTLKGAPRVVELGAPRPPYDLQCPLMSLPLAFGTTLATIPADEPYLFADPAKVAAYGRSLRPRVGLVWEGNASHDPKRRRAIPLRLMEPLRQLPIELHALQKDIGPDDAALVVQWGIVQHAEEQHDFADAAALVEAMDLVLTVDTAMAHVAGALGKPVWLLLAYVAEWRWLIDREDSPWYPTMRLFRQSKPGDWDSVVRTVASALADRRQ